MQAVDLFPFVVEQLHLVLHLFLEFVVRTQLRFQFALLVLYVLFNAADFLFGLHNLLIAFVELAVMLALELHELFLGLKDSFLLDHFGFGFGFPEGRFAALADRGPGHHVGDRGIDRHSADSRDDCPDNGIHRVSSALVG